MVRALFLTIVLTLMPVGAVAQLSLEPTLKVHPSPPLGPQTKPVELNPTCPCNEVRQEPIYQDGAIVRYQSVTKPTGTWETRCCR
jgi:hypothetical protein